MDQVGCGVDKRSIKVEDHNRRGQTISHGAGLSRGGPEIKSC